MSRLRQSWILVALLVAGGALPALAQQRTLFDAFKSIFQSKPSPNIIQVAPERPRKIRKPTPAPAAPRRVVRQVKEPPAPAYVGMPWPNAVTQSPAQPDLTASPTAAEDKPALPKPTFYVQVLGDSIALLLAQGLSDALADRPEIAIVKHAKESSGLVRDDYFDWLKTSRDLLSGTEQTDIAVLMVGSNDHQPFYAKDGKTLAEIGSEDWIKLYRARAEEEAKIFKDKQVKLIWVGMPIMRSAKFAADMLQLNEIYKDVAASSGATYVDVWQAFADEKGEFDSSGPDVNGQPARLRTADGIHFTKAGQRKLASFVEKDIRRIFEAKKPVEAAPVPVANLPSPDAVAPQDLKPPQDIKPQEAKPQETKQPEAETKTLVAPPEPVKILRPVSGAVVSLTTPPSTSDGLLLPPVAQRKALTRLEDPDPTDAHNGRTDDFAWPPN